MIEYRIPLGKNKGLLKINMTKVLKQFFTPQKYSQIMIENLNITSPKKIIDLSMGEGSLLIEAMRLWENSKYIGNDIDIDCCNNIKKEYHDKIICFNENIFEKTTIRKIIKDIGRVDLCLGNPPFQLISQNTDTVQILNKYNLNMYSKLAYIPAEVIFILQCLNILEKNGTLSIILPDGFFVNNSLKDFRQFLLNNYKMDKIIELPNKIFDKTDAKTHILVMKNIKTINNNITLKKVGSLKSIQITSKEAIERMDYSFYENITKYTKYSPLSNLDIEFLRGTPRYLMKDIDNDYIIHTTNLSKNKYFRNQLKTSDNLLSYKYKIAKAGDILLARVGTSCIGKVSIVESGYFIITDCIFIIRAKDINMRNKIYNSLCSKEGQMWIKSTSKGVSAKHITLEDIKKFPYLEGLNVI